MINKQYLKILFVGCTTFSQKCINTILKLKNMKVVGIVTSKENFKISYSLEPVKNYQYFDFKKINNENIPIFYLKNKMSDETLFKNISSLKPDIIVVAGWYHMIPKKWRELKPTYGLHASLLPKYTGGAPLVWALINNEKFTGITMFKMMDGVDNGPIIGQEKVKILKKENIKSLYIKIEKKSQKLLKNVLPKIFLNSFNLIDQNESLRTTFKQRNPSDGKINWNFDAEYIDRFIRAQTKPYPGAFTYFNKKKLIIWKADVISTINYLGCGEIQRIKRSYIIGCKKSSIVVKKIRYLNKDYNSRNLNELFGYTNHTFDY